MIGKVINTLLTANAGLTALVPAVRIFPYVMNEGTPLPAIIYTIDSLTPEYDKDGWNEDEVSFSVVSFSGDYANLQSIVQQVRAALEGKRGTSNGITYHKIYLSNQTEGYNTTEDVFLNKLTFRVIVNNY